MKLLALSILSSLSLAGQTRITAQQLGCPPLTVANATVIQAFTLLQIPGIGTMPVPLCLTLGSGFTLDRSTWTLNVTPVIAPMPTILNLPSIQQFSLDPSIPQSTLTVTFALSKTPIAGTPVLAFFSSSQAVSGVSTATVAGGGQSPTQIIVTLPTYRPFTADDRITIVYWGQ